MIVLKKLYFYFFIQLFIVLIAEDTKVLCCFFGIEGGGGHLSTHYAQKWSKAIWFPHKDADHEGILFAKKSHAN